MLRTPKCAVCNNPTSHPSGKCHHHRSDANSTDSMAFLTRPGNEELLRLKLASSIVSDLDGEDEFEESGQVTLAGLELPKPEDLPPYAVYRNRRVRVVGSPRQNVFEIMVDDKRTTVKPGQLRFLDRAPNHHQDS